jgi:endonuclease YncB( thermonuclease family)
MGRYRAALLLILVASQPLAAKTIFGPYSSLLISNVKDGDTIEVMVNVWPDTYVLVDVRIRGIDTPETRHGSKNGVKIPECEISRGNGATSYARDLIEGADQVTLINVDPSATKYAGRVSGDLLLDGVELFSESMITAGHAVKYDGGPREIWPCE